MKRKSSPPARAPLSSELQALRGYQRNGKPSAVPTLLALNGKFISRRAKAELLGNLKRLGWVPEDVATSRDTIRREHEKIAHTATPHHGPFLIRKTFMTQNGLESFPVQNPCAMLYHALATSDAFAWYFTNALQQHGHPSATKPWELVLYFDEITCGAPLAMGSHRKIQGVYWSLYELGPEALSDHCCWFEVVAFQNDKVKEFMGAMSHCVEVVLDTFFVERDGLNLGVGVQYNIRDKQTVTLTLALGIIIADVKALIETSGANGVNAVLPCFLCERVLSWSAKARAALINNDTFQTLSCLDHDKFGKRRLHGEPGSPSSGESIIGVLQRLDTCPDAELKAKQTLTGFKRLPRNFAIHGRAIVDPVQHFFLDFMHLEFQTGNWNRVTFKTLKLAKQLGLPAYDECGIYCRAWSFPAGTAPSWSMVFSPSHYESCNNKDAQYFKCQASDGLGLYPLICRFLSVIVLPQARAQGLQHMEDAIRCVLCHTDVIDCLVASKHGAYCSSTTLRWYIQEWGQALTIAWGDDLWYPKTHLLYAHFADQLERLEKRHGNKAYIPACWAMDSRAFCLISYYTRNLMCLHGHTHNSRVVLLEQNCTQEAHHKIVRRFVQKRENKINMEQGLAEELVVAAHRRLASSKRFDLIEPRDPSATQSAILCSIFGSGIAAARVRRAAVATVGPFSVSSGDVVIYEAADGLTAGDVYFFGESDWWPCSAFTGKWVRVADGVAPEFWNFQMYDDVVRVPLETILATCTYTADGRNACVYVPPTLR